MCFDLSAMVALSFSAGPPAGRTAPLCLNPWRNVVAGTTAILALALMVSAGRQSWATAERPIAILEPTTWINQRLPILDQIDMETKVGKPKGILRILHATFSPLSSIEARNGNRNCRPPANQRVPRID